MLYYKVRKVIPNIVELKEKILREAHCTSCTAHPGSTKMYQDLKSQFWWDEIKEVAEFVAKCSVCQLIKAEHQRPAGELQPLPILE